jgi:hypothetical protein
VIESREAGVDHAEIGGLLGKRWKLQEDLVAAIAGHHDLTRCATPQQRKRAAFVAIADWMCYQAGFPALAGGVAIETPGQWDESGIDPASLAPAVDELGNSKQTVDEFLSLAA